MICHRDFITIFHKRERASQLKFAVTSNRPKPFNTHTSPAATFLTLTRNTLEFSNVILFLYISTMDRLAIKASVQILTPNVNF